MKRRTEIGDDTHLIEETDGTEHVFNKAPPRKPNWQAGYQRDVHEIFKDRMNKIRRGILPYRPERAVMEYARREAARRSEAAIQVWNGKVATARRKGTTI